MSRQSQALYDRQITIFSPEGKLYQVEYAFRAVKGCNLTAIAIAGTDSVALVVQKKVATTSQTQQDKLLDDSCVTSLHNVTDQLGAAMIGMTGDCQAMLHRTRSIAWEFAYEKGYSIPPGFLAHKVANLNQIYTQHAYMRLHACMGIVVGIDDEEGPSIYRFDPAGWFAGFKACAAGTKEQEATNILEKLVVKKDLSNEEETIQAAIGALQTVMAMDFKAHEIEVGVVTKANPTFRRLSVKEIDDHLTTMAEKS